MSVTVRSASTHRPGVVRSALGRLRRGDSGAAAVEFAVLVSMLLLIVFGIVEFGLVIRDKIAVTSAVRTAGRVASSEPKACNLGSAGCAGADAVTGTPKGVSSMVLDTARTATSALTGVPDTSIQELWVYQASSDGKPTGGLASTATCVKKCVWYRFDPTYAWLDTSVTPNVTVTGRFRYGGGAWSSTDINACPGANTTTVGVYVKVRHQFILGSFVVKSSSISLSDYSAFRFEPQPTLVGVTGAGGCAPTT